VWFDSPPVLVMRVPRRLGLATPSPLASLRAAMLIVRCLLTATVKITAP